MEKQLKQIYDIHSHILFGVDDGSESFEQSKKMLGIASAEGISGIFLTPHHNVRYKRPDAEQISSKMSQLQDYIETEKLGIKLYLGSEIFYSSEREEDFAKGNITTMAGSRYVLLEFLPSVIYGEIKKAVKLAQGYGKIPIIAHAERYECLVRDELRFSELNSLGAYIQVNASSVVGDNGHLIKKVVKRLLKYEEIHFIGTDAHGDVKRSPKINECVKYITKKCGAEYASRVFYENPQCIIEDKYIN